MLNIFKRKTNNNRLIAFDTETAFHGEHGKIVVSSKIHHQIGREISFGFIGVLRVPALTLEIVQQIYREATQQGYVVHEITQYGGSKNNQ